MKKLLLSGAAIALMAGGAAFAPAQAADYEGCLSDAPGTGPAIERTDVCGGFSQNGTGYVYIDGASTNQDPLDGYISASNDGSLDENGVCASDEGDAHEEYDENGNRIEDDAEQPTCVSPV